MSGSRPPASEVLDKLGILHDLRSLDPHLAGTPPLGVDLPDSDIDILCHAPDPLAACRLLWACFHARRGFSVRQWRNGSRPVIARFEALGWQIEVFAAPEPVARQAGWRHFQVERRLLELGGPPLREAVLALRRQGLKTEPAFARLLGLPGDPFCAMLDLAEADDDGLAAHLARAGFHPVAGAAHRRR
ncbi:DUF4269 domain-containing protein [Pseudoroseomonas globiformis]|uniref:DUF4269 domain-containing protein n=1 Tax=Teichococcus globiformis TaxID=2307229 RepID=A0ABV7FWV8_9PROT